MKILDEDLFHGYLKSNKHLINYSINKSFTYNLRGDTINLKYIF